MDKIEIEVSLEDFQRLLVFQLPVERFADDELLKKGIQHALIPLDDNFSRGIILRPGRSGEKG